MRKKLIGTSPAFFIFVYFLFVTENLKSFASNQILGNAVTYSCTVIKVRQTLKNRCAEVFGTILFKIPVQWRILSVISMEKDSWFSLFFKQIHSSIFSTLSNRCDCANL